MRSGWRLGSSNFWDFQDFSCREDVEWVTKTVLLKAQDSGILTSIDALFHGRWLSIYTLLSHSTSVDSSTDFGRIHQ